MSPLCVVVLCPVFDGFCPFSPLLACLVTGVFGVEVTGVIGAVFTGVSGAVPLSE